MIICRKDIEGTEKTEKHILTGSTGQHHNLSFVGAAKEENL